MAGTTLIQDKSYSSFSEIEADINTVLAGVKGDAFGDATLAKNLTKIMENLVGSLKGTSTVNGPTDPYGGMIPGATGTINKGGITL